MVWLLAEMALALGVLVAIVWWTFAARVKPSVQKLELKGEVDKQINNVSHEGKVLKTEPNSAARSNQP